MLRFLVIDALILNMRVLVKQKCPNVRNSDEKVVCGLICLAKNNMGKVTRIH
jgi:hypothetical protein